MVTPGAAGDWLQASILAAALAGLAAAGGWALRQEDRHAPSGDPQPSAVSTASSAEIVTGGLLPHDPRNDLATVRR
jgi:hypothetical protein